MRSHTAAFMDEESLQLEETESGVHRKFILIGGLLIQGYRYTSLVTNVRASASDPGTPETLLLLLGVPMKLVNREQFN